MPIRKTINVSFPRSGHHMLRDALQSYFGEEMKYCKWSDDFDKRSHEDTNFTMVHDMHLTFPMDPNHKHLVLIRHPFYSLASWRIHQRDPLVVEDSTNEIAKQKLIFWANWANRWILGSVPNRLIVSYERLVMAPRIRIAWIIQFMTGSSKVDESKVAKAVEHISSDIPNTTDAWIDWI